MLKERTPRDPAYLRWLRSLDCAWCHAPAPCEASHHGRRGTGIKASDLLAIPLCHACHKHHHGPRYGNAPPLPGAPPGFSVREWAAEQAQELRALYEYEALNKAAKH